MQRKRGFAHPAQCQRPLAVRQGMHGPKDMMHAAEESCQSNLRMKGSLLSDGPSLLCCWNIWKSDKPDEEISIEFPAIMVRPQLLQISVRSMPHGSEPAQIIFKEPDSSVCKPQVHNISFGGPGRIFH